MKWYRMYSSVLHDPKVQRLSPALFKHWVNILCIANESEPRGFLPSVEDIAFQLRIKPSEAERAMAQLRRDGLVDRASDGREFPHNWPQRQRESDDVATRVRKHRSKDSGNEAYSDSDTQGDVTLHETLLKRTVDTDTDKESDTEENIHVTATEVDMSGTADASTGHDDVRSTEKKVDRLYSEDSDPYQLAVCLRDAIRAHSPKARLPKTRAQIMNWAQVLDLMIRIDEREPFEIADMITWSTRHKFWRSVVLSPGKLRDKYDAMHIQREESAQNGHAPQPSTPDAEEDSLHAIAGKRTQERLAALRAGRQGNA